VCDTRPPAGARARLRPCRPRAIPARLTTAPVPALHFLLAPWQRWEWVVPAPGDERLAAGGGGYLCLRHVHRRARPAARDAPAAGPACELELEEADVEEPDAATLTVGETHQPVHVYDYHVVPVRSPAPRSAPPTHVWCASLA